MDARFLDSKLKGLLVSMWGDYGLLPSVVTFMQHALINWNNMRGKDFPPGIDGKW